MSKTETLSIDLLRLDGDTQSRLAVNADTVEEYAELITASKGKWPFGQIIVYHDGSNYYVADGFHRTLAANKAGRASVPCDVKKGTARDARFYGMKANDQHGLRMSREDRRSNVVWMLDKYPDMTQSNIADNAGVSLRTVATIVADLKPKNVQVAHSASKTLGKSSEAESKLEEPTRVLDDEGEPDADQVENDQSDVADEAEQFPDDETMAEICQRETSEIEAWARKFGDMLKEAQKALAAVPTLDELNARGGWERKLNEALATLRGTKPVVCPICQGDGGTKCPCGGHGRITKRQHGQMV